MIKNLVIMLLAFPILCACGPKIINTSTEISVLTMSDFKGLKLPEIYEVKLEGKSEVFPSSTFDDVWDSSIKVLIQQGIILQVSKNTGLIVTATNPPSVVFIERDEERVLNLIVMDGKNNNPSQLAEKVAMEIMKGSDFTKLANRFSSKRGPFHGGDLGYIRKHQLIPEIRERAFSIKKGEVTVINQPDVEKAYIIKADDVREVVVVYFKCVENLYKIVDEPEAAALAFTNVDEAKKAKRFFEKLTTQVYANRKWEYLY